VLKRVLLSAQARPHPPAFLPQVTDIDITVEGMPVLRTVGRYEIVREVGRGGTAIVYLARQTDLGRNVALKELASFHAANPEAVERFLRESRLVGSLNHPNVVTVHEYLEHEGTAYIAMEYFERGSLRPWVGRLTIPQVSGVLDGLLAGLVQAESRGIVHRDLKPENVMVTTDGGIKITDFGIAKAVQAWVGHSLTASGTTVGTPEYMAPEQALGEGIGPWTDLYAVGVIAYELLAGVVPFPETEMPLATLLRHVNEPVPPLLSKAPRVDSRLANWVERMLEKQPDDRPGTAAEARDQLEEAILGVLGPRWRRRAGLNGAGLGEEREITDPLEIGQIDGSTPPTAVSVAVRRKSVEGRRGWRRSRVAWLAAILSMAAVAGGLALAVVMRDHEATTGDPSAQRRSLLPDYLPRPDERLSIVVAGPHLVVSDPRGRLVQLDRSTLRTRRVVPDPAAPLAPAVRSGQLFVADGEAITARRVQTLAPVKARALRGGVALTANSGGPLVVGAKVGTRGGRVCEIRAIARPSNCVRLPFTPSGVGANTTGTLVAAADGDRGRVVLLRPAGARLVRAGPPIAVGPHPQGDQWFFGGQLFVPIERGIAVVDVGSRQLATTIRLPVAPADIWISRAGRIYAALPALDRLAVVEVASPARPPVLLAAGRRPVAIAGARETLFVASGADKRVIRVDGRTGERTGAARVAALGAPTPKRTVLHGVTSRGRGATRFIILALAGGGLDSSGVVVRDANILDGRASVELWQGAIGSSRRLAKLRRLTVQVERLPGRLVVRLSARAGSYTALRVRRRGEHSVVIALTARQPKPAPTTRTTSPPAPPDVFPPSVPQSIPARPKPAQGDTCCETG
jgi:Protein kinase domain